jgi:large subunit ribosomal protein L15
MKYNELTIESHKTTKRLGRGIASGKGKTAGRGTKGQGARKSSNLRPGFEGGQNPIMQRLPKLPGFNNHRPKAMVVYTGDLERFAGKTVDAQVLADSGLIADAYGIVKVIVGGGDLTKKVTVKLQAVSAGALALIEKAGGSFEKSPRLQRPARPSDDK